MGDGEIQHQARPIQGHAKIRPLPMLGARLWDRPKTGIAKKGHQKLQHNGVASSNRCRFRCWQTMK